MSFHIDEVEIRIKFKHGDSEYNDATTQIVVNGVFSDLNVLTTIISNEFQNLYTAIDNNLKIN